MTKKRCTYIYACPDATRLMKQMTAELLLSYGIIGELKAELNGNQQRLIRFHASSIDLPIMVKGALW